LLHAGLDEMADNRERDAIYLSWRRLMAMAFSDFRLAFVVTAGKGASLVIGGYFMRWGNAANDSAAAAARRG
jgi:hypothetical protein